MSDKINKKDDENGSSDFARLRNLLNQLIMRLQDSDSAPNPCKWKDRRCEDVLKQCDSLFSTCCDNCRKRKLLADKGIVISTAVDGAGNPRESDLSAQTEKIKSFWERTEPWDIWRGRTVEFDVCKFRNRDKRLHVPYTIAQACMYRPYQKQRESWLYSRACGPRTGNYSSRLPLYLREPGYARNQVSYSLKGNLEV